MGHLIQSEACQVAMASLSGLNWIGIQSNTRINYSLFESFSK